MRAGDREGYGCNCDTNDEQAQARWWMLRRIRATRLAALPTCRHHITFKEELVESGVILGESWGYALAFVWGAAIAIAMRKTKQGRFLAQYAMWLVVATGAGVDLLIVRVWFTDAAGRADWTSIVIVFFLSSIVIAVWSVSDLSDYLWSLIDGISGKQD